MPTSSSKSPKSVETRLKEFLDKTRGISHLGDDLFTLHKQEDGTFKAELGSKLGSRAAALSFGFGGKEPEEQMFRALAGLAAIRPMESRSSLSVLKVAHAAFAPLMWKILKGEKLEDRREAARELLGRINTVINDLAEGKYAKRHGNALTVTVGTLTQPIPLLAIQCACALVEMHQALPTKRQVREIMETTFNAKASERQWVQIWKLAGLETLPKEKKWPPK